MATKPKKQQQPDVAEKSVTKKRGGWEQEVFE